jgi:hypothetical protein
MPYDNAIQSQKYTSIGRFQQSLKVFVPLASTGSPLILAGPSLARPGGNITGVNVDQDLKSAESTRWFAASHRKRFTRQIASDNRSPPMLRAFRQRRPAAIVHPVVKNKA